MTASPAQLIAAASEALQARMYHVPTPPDAVTTSSWDDDGDGPFRTFAGSSWQVPISGDADLFRAGHDIGLAILGMQYADGSCARWVVAQNMPEDIPPAALRMLAESFADAHAEIERFNNTPVFAAAR